jgi:DNA-binding response OmpR family regulator
VLDDYGELILLLARERMTEHRKLLVVDDQSEICEVMQTYLAEQGYDVDYATDSPSARRRLADDSYELVILDIEMPAEGGLQLAKIAKEQDINVLLMSGHPMAVIDEAQKGSCSFLSKPFHLDELKAAVRLIMDRPDGANGPAVKAA